MNFKEGGSREAQPNLLSESLKNKLTSVRIESIQGENAGLELFKMDITNRKKWESPKELEKLCDIFGESVLQAFGERDKNSKFDMQDPGNRTEALENIKDGDFGDSDTIYVVAENGKPIGFLNGKNVEVLDGQKGFFVNLIFVSAEKRKLDISGELYRQMFKHGNYDAIIGCSSTPAAVKKRLSVGSESGFDTFFCGLKNGNPKDRGSAEEQSKVKKLSRQVQQEYAGCESAIPMNEMPADHVVILEEVEPMPPITEKDIKFKEGDPMKEIFLNEVLATQKKHLPNTVYSILISLKRE